MPWHPLERTVLADALPVAGPGSHALCAGWCTDRLAAHVVLRERDLLTSAGIALGPLTARTDRVTLAAGDRAADPDGYARLVAAVRVGPPTSSPLRRGGIVLATPGGSARIGKAPADPCDDLVVHRDLADVVLHACGRTSVAHVELEGTDDHARAMESIERRA